MKHASKWEHTGCIKPEHTGLPIYKVIRVVTREGGQQRQQSKFRQLTVSRNVTSDLISLDTRVSLFTKHFRLLQG
jgi:hypothetical protein